MHESKALFLNTFFIILLFLLGNGGLKFLPKIVVSV
jgi:hypothetical protein